VDSFADLIKETGVTMRVVLPETTCKCFNKGKAAVLKCKECNGKGLIKNPIYPHDGTCNAGHKSTNEKFWLISGPAVDRKLWGVYCNDCTLVINAMVRKKKGL
jgi:hypothetical protein